MKKYNKPEIEALALETIDVIAASDATVLTQQTLETAIGNPTTTYGTKQTVSQFDTGWSW